MAARSHVSTHLPALLGAAGDSDESVREAICSAITKLGSQSPEEFVSLAVEHLRSGKLSGTARELVLRATTQVSRNALPTLGAQHLTDVLLEPAVTELMRSRDPEPVLAAQSLLELLGEGSTEAVLRALLGHCEAGIMPQPCVLRTIADIANARPAVGVPALKMELLPRLMPQLGAAKGEARVACAYALMHYANAVAQLVEERGERTATGGREGAAAVGLQYGSEMASALEYTYAQWLPAREDPLRFAAAEALTAMVGLLAPEQLQPLLPRLVPGLLAAVKREREGERLPVTQALWATLAHTEACSLQAALQGDGLVHSSLAELHALLCAPLDRNSSAALRTHNEQLRCFEVLGQLYAEETIGYLLKALEDAKATVAAKCGTMEALRHLVPRLQAQLRGSEQSLLAGVSVLLNEADCRVRLALTELTGTLGSQGYLQHAGGQRLVLFMVRQAAIPDAEADEKGRGRRARHSDAVSVGMLREVGTKTLDLLCSTVEHMRPVLWPLLFECVVPYAPSGTESLEVIDLTPAAAVVCKCLLQIATRLATSAPSELTLPFHSNPNLPSPHALLCRLLLFVCAPHRRPQLGERALQLLHRLAPQLHAALPPLWANHAPKLLSFLQSATWSEDVGLQWEELCLRFIGDSLDAVGAASDGPSWLRLAGEEALRQLPGLSSEPQLQAHMLCLLGSVIQRSSFKELLERGMHAMLAATKPLSSKPSDAGGSAAIASWQATAASQAMVRRGCAVGFGCIAAAHLDPVLDSLQAALRTAAAPPPVSSGFFSFLSTPARPSEAAEAEVATLLLCVGHAASRASPSLLLPRAETLASASLIQPAREARGATLKASAAAAFELFAAAMHAAAQPEAGSEAAAAAVAASARGLEGRNEMVEVSLKFLEEQAVLTADELRPLRRSCFAACALLVALQPPPPPALCSALLRAVVEQTRAAPDPADADDHDDDHDHDGDGDGASDGGARVCGKLLEAMLALRLNATSLFTLLGALLPLAHSLHAHERLRALHLASRLLSRELQLRSGRASDAPAAANNADAARSVLDGDSTAPQPLPLSSAGTVPGSQQVSITAAWRNFVSTEPALDGPLLADSGGESGGGGDPQGWGGPTALGDAIGMVLPRCADPDGRVRRFAAQCVMALLHLAAPTARLEGSAGAAGGGPADKEASAPASAEQLEAQGEAAAALQLCCESDELQPRLEAQRRLVPALQSLLPAAALQQLVRTLVAGLAAEWHGAAAACVALNGLLQDTRQLGRGGGGGGGAAGLRPLHEVAPEVVASLLQMLPKIDEPMPSNGALAVVRSIARQNTEAVMACLLAQPVPLPPPTVTVVQRLARDEVLLSAMLSRLTEVVNDSETATREAASAAVALLTAVLEEEEASLASHNPELVASLVMRLGAAKELGKDAEAAARQAVRAFLHTLPDEPGAAEAEEAKVDEVSMDFGVVPLSAPAAAEADDDEEEDDAAVAMEAAALAASGMGAAFEAAAPAAAPTAAAAAVEAEEGEETPADAAGLGEVEVPVGKAALLSYLATHDRADAVATAKGLGSLLGDESHHACGVRLVFDRLYPYVSSRHAAQREALTAAVAQFATAAMTDASLTRHIMHLLLGRLNDDAAAVRLHALHGLRRMSEAAHAPQQGGAQLEIGQLLGSLGASLDDADEEVALAAFGALRRALPGAPAQAVVPLLLSMCVRARAAAERTSAAPAVRAAGFGLFGVLTRFGGHESVWPAFVEHAHALLPSLLLHLRHPQVSIRRGCMGSTRALAPLLGMPTDLDLHHDDSGSQLRQLGEGLAHLHPMRVAAYLTGCAEQFASDEACVRADAALLAGTLMARSGGAGATSLVTSQLTSMLKDADATVRLQAARALGGA